MKRELGRKADQHCIAVRFLAVTELPISSKSSFWKWWWATGIVVQEVSYAAARDAHIPYQKGQAPATLCLWSSFLLTPGRRQMMARVLSLHQPHRRPHGVPGSVWPSPSCLSQSSGEPTSGWTSLSLLTVLLKKAKQWNRQVLGIVLKYN